VISLQYFGFVLLTYCSTYSSSSFFQHYIPLDDFATNVEERMQWIVDHDEEAQRISERATLWMEDLIFHPDAAEDDRLIQEEILRRYQSHFRPQQ
jgi:Glycosyl transferase family 90